MNKGSFYFPYQAVSHSLDLFDLVGLAFPGYSFLQNPSNVDQSTLSNCRVNYSLRLSNRQGTGTLQVFYKQSKRGRSWVFCHKGGGGGHYRDCRRHEPCRGGGVCILPHEN